MNDKIFEKMIYLLNKVNQIQKKPRNYGTDSVLYQSEIHIMEAVSHYENTNASELAKILGVTNGAIAQVADKLIKKGFIEKYRILNNKKEVYYRVTARGEIAVAGHEKERKERYSNVFRYLNSLSPNNIKAINSFIDKMIESWPRE